MELWGSSLANVFDTRWRALNSFPKHLPPDIYECQAGHLALFFTLIFIKKARSAFLFYKFYKFREKFTFKFIILSDYRCGIGPLKCGIGPLKCGIGPLKCGIGPKGGVDRCDILFNKRTYGKDNRSGRRSGL